MSAVAIIPAKGSSSRIPFKNRREFNDQPMISYSIRTAIHSRLFDAVYVSTEDSIISVIAADSGAKIIDRPPELAEINAPDYGTQVVALHALKSIGRERGYACCIYPCAPMMTSEHLTEGLTVIRATKRPYVYAKGWFYWGRVRTFLDRPELGDDSLRLEYGGIDIDTEEDWLMAEKMFAGLLK